MAELFLDLPDDGQIYTVDHYDQDSKNNKLSNLRWATGRQQIENRGKNS